MSIFNIENNINESKNSNINNSNLKTPDKKRVIFHVDVNSAYLSWTAVDMLKKGHPVDIRDEVSVISSKNGSRYGMILAKSIKAKEIGIEAAMPIVEAFRKAPNLKLYEPDHDLYIRCSKAFIKILFKYSELVKQTSIDEAFIDMTDYLGKRSPYDVAIEIKEEIQNTLGFTVNIGVANSPAIAKTISDFKKPNMIHMLMDKDLKEKLWPLDISKLYMAGKKTVIALRKIGINTIGDLATSDKKIIEKTLGKSGIRLREYANGIDDSVISTEKEQMKSISHAETFYTNIKNVDTLLAHLMSLTEKATYRLRKKGLYANSVGVLFRYPDFKEISKQHKIPSSNDTYEIYKELKKMFNDMYKGRALRLIGIKLGNLSSEPSSSYISIFDLSSSLMENDSKCIEKNSNSNTKNNLALNSKDNNSKKKPYNKNYKRNSIDSAVDSVNELFGKPVITRATNLSNVSDKKKSQSAKFKFGIHEDD